MKAVITGVEFKKEFESKFGKLYSYSIQYDGKQAYYSSKSKDQTKFKIGVESEFNEEKRTGSKGEYLIIKPIQAQFNSNYGRQLKKEQSRYSGFAMSYAKDLVIAGKIKMEELLPSAKKMFDFMVSLDKTIES